MVYATRLLGTCRGYSSSIRFVAPSAGLTSTADRTGRNAERYSETSLACSDGYFPADAAWAREFGATHTINAVDIDVYEAIEDLTDGFGAGVVIDAVGRPATWTQAFYGRDLAGTVVLVGVPDPDMHINMPLVDFFSRGGSLKSSWYGDCLPERDFPTLISLYMQGRLPLDKFVSERIGLKDIEDAFAKMHAGQVLRSVVVLR
jgi:S-(hydroxymethyl)mycothiol dehydrogenase